MIPESEAARILGAVEARLPRLVTVPVGNSRAGWTSDAFAGCETRFYERELDVFSDFAERHLDPLCQRLADGLNRMDLAGKVVHLSARIEWADLPWPGQIPPWKLIVTAVMGKA